MDRTEQTNLEETTPAGDPADQELAERLLVRMGLDGSETFDAAWLAAESGFPPADLGRALRHLQQAGDVSVTWPDGPGGPAESATVLFQGRFHYQLIKGRYPAEGPPGASFQIFDLPVDANDLGRGHQRFPHVGDQVWVGETLATVTDVATFALSPESAREDPAYGRYLEVRVQLGVKDE